MKYLIKLKHWQAFIIYFSGLLLHLIFFKVDLDFGIITSLELAGVFAIFTLIFFFLWVLAIGIFTNNIKGNPHRFKNGLLIFAVLCATIGYANLNLERVGLNGQIPEWVSMVLMPLTLFGIIYTFYNVSKSIKSIETNKVATLSEYILDAILLFAFPIGVWFIQPRLNDIYVSNESTKNEK